MENNELDFYHVIEESPGCKLCGSDSSYLIIGKDDIATSASYENKDDAEDICMDLNRAIRAYKHFKGIKGE